MSDNSLSKEIEIKAYVRDFDYVLNYLYNNAKFKKKYFKKDIYYARENEIKSNDIRFENCIRLRVQNGGYTFCSKKRSIIDGVEVNDEREVKVSKKKARFIINFLSSLQGYKELVRKEKRGYSFSYKGTIIDLSHVKGLDDFIEIEFLDSKLSQESQIKELKTLLSELSISEADIEAEAYMTLLMKNNK